MSVAVLDKVSEDVERPLWSVMIPVYNCAAYLRFTLESVLEQALPEAMMEIVVVDDCSTDDPEAVIRDVGRGRVKFVRQPVNLGHSANFETCLSLSRGKLIQLLHGDDRVLPGFYKAFTHFFEDEPNAMAAFCRCNFIDENNVITNTTAAYAEHAGLFTGFMHHITRGQIIQTPTIVVKREVYESIGMFNRQLSWCEDWEMWARIGKHYPVGFINEILAQYRVHTKSNSGQYIVSGENVRDLKRAIEIINKYIENPAERAGSKKIVSAYYAGFAIDTAKYLLEMGNKHGARNQLRAAFMMSSSKRVNLRIIKLFLKTL